MSAPVRIIAYLRHYPPPMDGGAYVINFHLFAVLKERGFALTILSHADVKAITSANFSVIPVASIRTGRYKYPSALKKFADLLFSTLALRRELKRGNYAYVFSDAGYLQNLIVFLASFRTRTKIIGINLTEEISIIQKETKFRAWLQRWLLRRHFCNIIISNYVGSLLLEIGVTCPAFLIHPAFLLTDKSSRLKTLDRDVLVKKYNLAPSAMLVGFVGRHIKRKGLTNLLSAVKQLLDDGHNICLLIAGEGPDTPLVSAWIQQMNLGDKIKMVGVVYGDEKDMFFSGIDLFAMPNYTDPQTGDTEGFGIVFLEAAQQSTPVIGGKDGGTPEAISDGYNGYIVDGHSVVAIKEAIEKYYADPFLRTTHGEHGKVWAQSFDWQNQLEHLSKCLITQ